MIDMAFIDADKVSYPFYYERVMDILRTGGLIAMDNMLQGGTVLSPRDESAGGIDALDRRITAEFQVEEVKRCTASRAFSLRLERTLGAVHIAQNMRVPVGST